MQNLQIIPTTNLVRAKVSTQFLIGLLDSLAQILPSRRKFYNRIKMGLKQILQQKRNLNFPL